MPNLPKLDSGAQCITRPPTEHHVFIPKSAYWKSNSLIWNDGNHLREIQFPLLSDEFKEGFIDSLRNSEGDGIILQFTI